MPILNCVLCGKEYKEIPSRVKIRKTCSKSCLAKLNFTGKKKTRQHILNLRHANAWKFTNEILADYQKGDAILWIARRYKSDKRVIRTILKEHGIKKLRGRKGITAWNKGKRCPQFGGENHWCWKGGISPVIMRIRRCAKYKQWVKTVFEQDNYTCQLCGKRGNGDIEADHYPKMFSEIIFEDEIKTFEEAMDCDRLWDRENGRTLCKNCHRKTFKFKKL